MQDHGHVDRLYIVTRADLPFGLGAAQAAHAAFEFAREHWTACAGWMRDSNFIVLVTVPDEAALRELSITARYEAHIETSMNYEPDLDGELTAIVLAPCPASKRLCSQLPLMGREMAMSP